MSLEKFSLRNFFRVLENPSILRGEATKSLISINKVLQKPDSDADVSHIMEEDWDNLILLDGCRYDLFSRQSTIDGQLEKRISAGSQSLEFIKENFYGNELTDTVYITANPFSPQIKSGTFHDIINLLPEWNEEHQTVMPETVVKATERAISEYPNKRLLVHFMQPHYPFIGPKGQSLDHRGYQPTSEKDGLSFSVWDELQYGVANYELEDVVEAYEENLDIVLEYVSELIPKLPGQTVISSDHGNLLGERMNPIPVRAYGHPSGLRSRELVEVPWLIIDGERKKVTAEEPNGYESIDDSIVEDRLTALGYAE